jgi:hypothetical protein
MLFNVPGGKSWLGFPDTVTRPGFVGCLNWRWPLRARTRYQPSAFNNFRTCRTFIPGSIPRGRGQKKQKDPKQAVGRATDPGVRFAPVAICKQTANMGQT